VVHSRWLWCAGLLTIFALVAAIAGGLVGNSFPGPASPLVNSYNRAEIVLLGTFTNAKLERPKWAWCGNDRYPYGTSDFVVEKVLKGHATVRNRKIIPFPAGISSKNKFLIFCTVYLDQTINLTRWEELLPESRLLEYLQWALKFNEKATTERLRVYFDYLKNADAVIALDVLHTLSFFWDDSTDVLNKEKLKEGMGMVTESPDVADLAIEELRAWKAWEMTDRVLDLFKRESHRRYEIRRSILLFALCSPSSTARAFVQEQRQRDPKWVAETVVYALYNYRIYTLIHGVEDLK
jgi:hypothetical protein